MATDLPWFPLYVPDFIASTMSMAPEVVGAYTRLLCYAWINGCIPSDNNELQRITGGMTPEAWSQIRARLVPHGDRDGDRVQAWVHPRMERERAKTEKVRKARQMAAEATNAKRKHGQRDGDRDGDRSGDRPYPHPHSHIDPPIAPPSRKGGRRRRLKELEENRSNPTYTPF